MENVLMHIFEYKYIYIAILLLFILIILSIILKPKKIKPIEVTIDDVNEEKSEIEKVIEALEENQNNRPMTSFEEEQEANAIISYQELVKAVAEKKANIEPSEIKKELEIPEELLNVEVEEKPRFKNSEFISPIFGKDNNTNDDFLKELKDFRSNL